MNTPRHFVILKADNVFARARIFASDRVPIKEIPPRRLTTFVKLEALDGEREVYLLDWSRLSIAQRGKVAEVAVAFAPRQPGERRTRSIDFVRLMDRGGEMPIRVEQVAQLEAEEPSLL